MQRNLKITSDKPDNFSSHPNHDDSLSYQPSTRKKSQHIPIRIFTPARTDSPSSKTSFFSNWDSESPCSSYSPSETSFIPFSSSTTVLASDNQSPMLSFEDHKFFNPSHKKNVIQQIIPSAPNYLLEVSERFSPIDTHAKMIQVNLKISPLSGNLIPISDNNGSYEEFQLNHHDLYDEIIEMVEVGQGKAEGIYDRLTKQTRYSNIFSS